MIRFWILLCFVFFSGPWNLGGSGSHIDPVSNSPKLKVGSLELMEGVATMEEGWGGSRGTLRSVVDGWILWSFFGGLQLHPHEGLILEQTQSHGGLDGRSLFSFLDVVIYRFQPFIFQGWWPLVDGTFSCCFFWGGGVVLVAKFRSYMFFVGRWSSCCVSKRWWDVSQNPQSINSSPTVRSCKVGLVRWFRR